MKGELDQDGMELLLAVLLDCLNPLADAGGVTRAQVDERARNTVMAIQGAFLMEPIPDDDP